jgi:hypothetical protein
MMDIKEFFGPGSILTFTGATGIVWTINSAFRLLLQRNPVWLLFFIALVVAYLGSYVAGTLHGGLAIFLAFVNGCLLFCTSAGIQSGASNAVKGTPAGTTKLHGASFRFWSSYFE